METGSTKLRRIPVYLLAILLWLMSAALGMYEIYLLREIVFSIFARFGREYFLAVTIGQVTVIVAALAWVIIILGSLEYHLKHIGTRKSWRLFAWIFGVEAVILIAAFLLN